VVSGERPRERAAVERLEDRGLHLEEPALVEPAADRRDHARAQDEELARLLVGDQVELALPVARLHVLEPVELLRRREQRLGEERPVVDADGQLAPPGGEGGAVHSDDVAQVERCEPLEALLAEHVAPGLELNAAGAVHEVEEGRAAVPATRGQPAGQPVARVGLGPGLEAVVRLAHALDRNDARILVREGVEAVGAQLLQLRAAVGRRLLGHAGSVWTSRQSSGVSRRD